MIPFGLCGAPSAFVRLMSKITDGLASVFAYLNDAIIYSESEKDHLEHSQAFFQPPSDYRLTPNSKKCIFSKKELDFLGNIITQDGFQTL